MVTVSAEKQLLEDGGRSLGTEQPKYKRRRVSAVRDFPPGCGLNAPPIELRTNEVVVASDNVDSGGQKGGDLSDVGAKSRSGNHVESQSPNKTDFFVKVEETNVDNEGEELVKESGDLKLDALAKKSMIETHKLSQNGQNVESLHETCEPLKDSTGVFAESLGLMEHTDSLDFEDREMDKAEKMVEENVKQSSFLAHYPIPSNLVSKERKYPPRRRVSAVRDFPPGCGTGVTHLHRADGWQVASDEDDHLCRFKMGAEKHKDITTAEDIIVYDENTVKNKMKGVISAGTVYHAEVTSEPHECASVELTARPIHFCKQSEVKAPLRNDEIKSQKPDGSITVSLQHSGKDKRAVGLEKNNKGKSTSVSASKILSAKKFMAGLDDANGTVIVQGLMAAPNCPWGKARGVVKSSPSSGVTGSKQKRGDLAGNAKSKLMVCEKQGNGRKPLKNMSPSMEADACEATGQLVLRVQGDFSENDEQLHNDWQLVKKSHDFNLSLPPFGAATSTDKGARSKVRETLRLFQAISRKLLQEEETKSKEKGNTVRRIDQHAARILKDKGKYVNTGKIIGPVPGVEVGDEFHYRVELMIIGLHRQSQGGIDFIKQGQKVIATSIVASGGYANDMDSSDVLIYTGQGGNTTGGDKQPEDQKLERGNLALKNNIDERTPVRVIRGFKETKSLESADTRVKVVSTYTYDGLYTVERYWKDIGPHGKMVYKFELRRLPGQPELAWKELKKSKKFKVREGRCVDDISGGKERLPICAVNPIDNEKPPPFTYITRMMYPDWYQSIPPKGCDCMDGCSDSEKCACAVRNGGEIPYNYNGAIVEAKPLVYECGPCCKCPPSCHNRVSQHGIKFQLEIFKTESRGWGVRSLSSIPSGSFICEYIGELLEDKEAEQRTGNDEYLFDIGQNYSDNALWDGLSTLIPDLPLMSSEVVEEGFTIDAATYGNVGRFINHSCSPNLYAQNVLYDNDDRRIPHIMLFAAENIPPLQELTYHYNYTIDQVHDSDGNIKKKSCYCGSSECTGRMY
ncbi:hypothetical protein Ancab_032902 [Ancistrocladus abbreviatus]